MSGLTIGYGGRGLVEPKIFPLVEAVNDAGFVTFSSCEGHIEGDRPDPFASVGFFAHENEAKRVHMALFGYRPKLACLWNLRGGFVVSRISNEFELGWTLESGGIATECGRQEEFVRKTVEAGWNQDIPLLVEMFRQLRG